MSLAGPSDSEAVSTHTDYLGGIFRRCVAVIAGTYAVEDGTYVEREAFEYMVMLAETRMQELFSSLLKFSTIQRRSQPSLQDIASLLSLHEINVCDLEIEKRRLSSDSPGAIFAQHLNQLQFTGDLEEIPQAEKPFYEAPRSILPSRRRTPQYAPAWVPALPPDHTYMKTPKYTNHVHNLQTLRERVFEEGQLAEQALQRVLGSSGSSSVVAPIDVANNGDISNIASSLTGDVGSFAGTNSGSKEISPMTREDFDQSVSHQSPASELQVGVTVGDQEQPSGLNSVTEPSTPSAAQLDRLGGLADKESTPLPSSAITGVVKREESPSNRDTELNDSTPKLPKLKLKALNAIKPETKSGAPKLRLSLGGGGGGVSVSHAQPQVAKRVATDNKIAKKHEFYGKRPRIDIQKLSQVSKSSSEPDHSNSQHEHEQDEEADAPADSTIDELFAGALMSVP